jgi:hypothetical protein
MACDADIVPVVLGSDGEVVDLGRATRLFTRGQRRMLWHRDRRCTFLGCTAPASWTQAHHIVHWADGGSSDLENATLLCQRHHTLVHDRRLIATVHSPDEHGRCVTWDLTPGSYDRDLSGRLAEFARARARMRSGRHRRRLDTGPPDGWTTVAPESVQRVLDDEFEAEHIAWMADEFSSWGAPA